MKYVNLNDVNYSEPSGGWKWVNNSGISGTATGGGIDYILASSTITIPAGQTTGTTTVTAVQELLDEGNETVILDILNVDEKGSPALIVAGKLNGRN